MDEKKIQQMFVQFLAQKYKLKSQQELEAKIQELGEEGLKAEYAEFQQVMAQQQTRKAMFGAKLNYIKGLKGQCPQGYEVKYYQQGGRVCTKCEAINKQSAPQNPIDAFKCGRKMKKKACGGRMKKNQEGGELNPSSKRKQKGYSPVSTRVYPDPESSAGYGIEATFNPNAWKLGSVYNGGTLPEVTVTPNGVYSETIYGGLLPEITVTPEGNYRSPSPFERYMNTRLRRK